MQEAVQYQMKACKEFRKGDVILSNHPAAGGSHLPDLTVITPVFHKYIEELFDYSNWLSPFVLLSENKKSPYFS